MQVKLREVCKSQNRASIYGLTVPTEIAIFFRSCYFSVEKSGNAIIFISGTSLIPTKEQIKNYDWAGAKL